MASMVGVIGMSGDSGRGDRTTSRRAEPTADEISLRSMAWRLKEDINGEIFLDVGPLIEDSWTGIPVVAAQLARALFEVFGPALRFFIGTDELHPHAVIDALDRSTGAFLGYDVQQLRAFSGPIRRSAPDKVTIGIYPSAKSSRRVFDYECSIIHDLTTLITPQFHTLENIAHHMEVVLDDINSNTVTVCVSASTARDVADYLGVAKDRLAVAYNGVSWRDEDVVAATTEVDVEAVEPFFLILGTREPRKNIALIFELLSLFPQLLNSHRFVITGKIGWLQESNAIPASLQSAVKSGRIFFTDFISDAEKCKLLMAADASIYPSFSEGFGLPVAESLSLGTPCIASCSSSIPEVGGECCTYFDPYSVLDLHRAVTQYQRGNPKRREEFRRSCIDSVAKFTWRQMAADILIAIENKISAARPN